MNNLFHIEVGYKQKNFAGQRICGDVFVFQKIKEENRTILVLSDGLGHGIKANVLATITATMALNFTKEHKTAYRIAEIIMNTLPICNERQISYSTFTIIDIEHTGKTTIIEYDNPQAIILHSNKKLSINWDTLPLVSKKHKNKELRYCYFIAKKEDRIIICSDGVVQSGMGSNKLPTGWGKEELENYITYVLTNNLDISAYNLATKIINKAIQNDNYTPKDDITCAVIYFREPRKILICTGPPYDKEKDLELAKIFENFQGKKIISGATTVEIIARELKKEIKDSTEFNDPELPPISFMEGADLITEGTLTLTKVFNILNEYN
ncbi:MAG TPA: SpoIIE family protein phosphatase, partial [Bacteroidales bacterium]|nr:SpoIIE family protein phosphatase [Bacteroidales bacterium]